MDMLKKERKGRNVKGVLKRNWILLATITSVILGKICALVRLSAALCVIKSTSIVLFASFYILRYRFIQSLCYCMTVWHCVNARVSWTGMSINTTIYTVYICCCTFLQVCAWVNEINEGIDHVCLCPKTGLLSDILLLFYKRNQIGTRLHGSVCVHADTEM